MEHDSNIQNEETDITTKKLSRRTLLKGLAAGGIVASALPAKWIQPAVQAANLPPHAQISPTATAAPLYSITSCVASLFIDLFAGTEVVGISATITPATAGIQIQCVVTEDATVMYTYMVATDAAGVVNFPTSPISFPATGAVIACTFTFVNASDGTNTCVDSEVHP